MSQGPDVLVAGGGIAGLETVLALHALSDGDARLMLVAPDPEFTYRPLLVREPFGEALADRIALAPAMEELGVGFQLESLQAVDVDARSARFESGAELGFDSLVICTGAEMRPALAGATTLWAGTGTTSLIPLLSDQAASPEARIDFVVPPGHAWSLPLYEVALMAARRLRELGATAPKLRVITPEPSPVAVFGAEASASVADLLEGAGLELLTDTWVREDDLGGALVTTPDRGPLAPVILALPVMSGRAPSGIPCDGEGFIPIDEHARVPGTTGIYAAGDGTNFPIKQGGIATQQADAAAEQIALEAGITADAEPFHPVLRGKLLTGAESLHMRADLEGGHGEGDASLDYLWWPPHKVSGRYLAPWLAGESLHADLEPPRTSIDVEVSIPREWHSEPMALDPLSPIDGG